MGVVLSVRSWASFIQVCVSVAVFVSVYEELFGSVLIGMHATKMREADNA